LEKRFKKGDEAFCEETRYFRREVEKPCVLRPNARGRGSGFCGRRERKNCHGGKRRALVPGEASKYFYLENGLTDKGGGGWIRTKPQIL